MPFKLGVVLGVVVGFMAGNCSAEESMSMEELDRMMDETLVLEYANCNELSVPSASMLAGIPILVSDRKPSERDIAVEVAMGCYAKWGEMVKQLASSRGYEEALRIGLLIQGKMIMQNITQVRSLGVK